MKLRIEMCIAFGTALVGRIVHQDESLRNADADGTVTLAERGDYSIESNECPDLGRRILYVRGADKENDDDIFFHQYPSADAALEALEGFAACVRKINGTDPAGTGRGFEVRVLE